MQNKITENHFLPFILGLLLSIPTFWVFWKFTPLSCLSSVLGALLVFLGIAFNSSIWAKNLIKYTVLLCIVFAIALPLLSDISALRPVVEKYALANYSVLTSISIVLLGSISLYQHRENLVRSIELTHQHSEINPEIKSPSSKYVQFSIAFLIFCMASAIYFYRLDYFNMYDDEYQITNVAEGYMNTGKFVYWDYVQQKGGGICPEENRLHIWLVAQCYKIGGVNEFTSRLPSAFFGFLYLLLIYFVSRYFTRNTFLSLLMVLIVLFDPEMVHFFRYCRTYSVFIPFFVCFFYCFYRAVAHDQIYSGNRKWIQFLNTNLNFNYLYLGISLALIPLLWDMKFTSIILLPAVFLFFLVQSLLERKRRYIIASILGIIGAFVVYFFVSYFFKEGVLSFFNSPKAAENKAYFDFLTQHSFSRKFFFAMLGLCIPMLVLNKNIFFRRKLLFFYSFSITLILFYTYVVNCGIYQRYIYHAVPLITLFLVLILFTFSKAIFNKYIVYGLALLLMLRGINSYSNSFEGNYLKNSRSYGQSQTAYNILMKNLKADDMVLSYCFRMYHFRNYTGKMPKIIDLWVVNPNAYTREDLIKDLKTSKKGWIIWQSFFSDHMRTEVTQYISSHFKKFSGEGIDDSKTELFYFDESMLVDKGK